MSQCFLLSIFAGVSKEFTKITRYNSNRICNKFLAVSTLYAKTAYVYLYIYVYMLSYQLLIVCSATLKYKKSKFQVIRFYQLFTHISLTT